MFTHCVMRLLYVMRTVGNLHCPWFQWDLEILVYDLWSSLHRLPFWLLLLVPQILSGRSYIDIHVIDSPAVVAKLAWSMVH